MEIINGRKIKEEILEEVKKEVEKLNFSPLFCDILVGNDEVSASYVRLKGKTAEEVGIKFRTAQFSDSITTEELIEEIENLNRVPHMCGIIVQLPLPDHIDRKKILDAISPELDVDCLGQINAENFYNNEGTIAYPTALACMKIIDSLKIDLSFKKILMIGQGTLVGRPVTHLLRDRGLNITTVDSKTENKDGLMKEADLIITAIGKAKYLKGDMIKDGVIVIDAGTSEDNGAVVGDVDIETMEKASFVSKTPGGVGPVTVAMLLKNVIEVAKNKK